MTTVVLRPEAEADLAAIALYVLEHSGEDRAAALSRKLRQRTKILAAHPHAGRLRPEIGEGVRGLVERPYVLLYRVNDETVDVVAVVHGARNLPAVALARLSAKGSD